MIGKNYQQYINLKKNNKIFNTSTNKQTKNPKVLLGGKRKKLWFAKRRKTNIFSVKSFFINILLIILANHQNWEYLTVRHCKTTRQQNTTKKIEINKTNFAT